MNMDANGSRTEMLPTEHTDHTETEPSSVSSVCSVGNSIEFGLWLPLLSS